MAYWAHLDVVGCFVVAPYLFYTIKSIYSSTKGKTTILRTIIGAVELDDGSVSVFNKQPGTLDSGIPGPIIGYMPQVIAHFALNVNPICKLL